MPFVINVNGKDRRADVPGDMPLLWVLRDEFGLLGTKVRMWHRAVRRLHRSP